MSWPPDWKLAVMLPGDCTFPLAETVWDTVPVVTVPVRIVVVVPEPPPSARSPTTTQLTAASAIRTFTKARRRRSRPRLRDTGCARLTRSLPSAERSVD